MQYLVSNFTIFRTFFNGSVKVFAECCPLHIGQGGQTMGCIAVRGVAQLRPYQQECLDICLLKFSQGVKKQAVSLPVGSGKTVIISHLIKNLPKISETCRKTLVLAHREELLEQAYEKICALQPNLLVDIEQGKRYASENADVIIASVPSLGRQNSDRLRRMKPEEFKLIIIDEAHHSAARSYLRILKYFGAEETGSALQIWGCSATLKRHDGLALGTVFDEISYHLELNDLIKKGWLCPITIYSVRTNVTLKGIKSKNGDFIQSSLANRVNVTERNEIIFKGWKALQLISQRKSTLVFAVNIDHVYALREVFRNHGILAEAVDGRMAKEDRIDILNRFRLKQIPVLINCNIFTEGTDIPCVDCVVMARPTRSSVLFQQMVGRGVRLYPDKKNCSLLLVEDICDSISVPSSPDLLGLDPQFLFESQFPFQKPKNDRSFNTKADAIASPSAVPASQSKATDRESTSESVDGEWKIAIQLFELKDFFKRKTPLLPNGHRYEGALDSDNESKNPAFFKDTTYSWCPTNSGRCYLNLGKDGIFLISKNDSKTHLVSTPKCERRIDWNSNDQLYQTIHLYGGTEFDLSNMRIKSLPITGTSFADVIRATDTFIKATFPLAIKLGSRKASWRQEPVTVGQMRILHRFGRDIGIVKNWSRGYAADVITHISLNIFFKRKSKELCE